MRNSRKSKVRPVGVNDVLRFVKRCHPRFVLPAEPIFAFVFEHSPNSSTGVLISEADARYLDVACCWQGHLGLDERALAVVHRAMLHEARLCGVFPRYNATYINATGILSFGVIKDYGREYRERLPPGW